jgi:glucan phosphoethanolaminetransferase (alkaline phosphatase superfamily)
MIGTHAALRSKAELLRWMLLLLPGMAMAVAASDDILNGLWVLGLSACALCILVPLAARVGNPAKVLSPGWLPAPFFLWHFLVFKGEPSPALLDVARNAHAPEAVEFLWTEAGLGLLLLSVGYWSLYLFVARQPFTRWTARRGQGVLALGLVSISALMLLQLIPASAARLSWPGALATFAASMLEARQGPSQHYVSMHPVLTGPETDVVVLVIGESARARNHSLHGYERQTTPQLNALAGAGTNLLPLQQAYSTANLTYPAVTMMLTATPPSDYFRASSRKAVWLMFKEAGYRVSWLSNNDPGVARELGVTADAAVNLHGSLVNQNVHDEELLPYFQHALAFPAPRKLVILHLHGSHFTYKNRYPRSFARWAETETDDYDSSIQYTDHVLSQLLARLEKESGRVFMLYLSDHGENLRSDGRGLWGHGQGKGSRDEFSIAGFTWTNAQWRKSNPLRASALKTNTGKVFLQEDVMPTLAGAANLQFDGFQPAHDMTSASYMERLRREVIMNGRVLPMPVQ